MKELPRFCLSIILLLVSCQQKPSPQTAKSITAEQPVPLNTQKLPNSSLLEYKLFLSNLDSADILNVSKATDRYVTLFKEQPPTLADSAYVLFDNFYLRVDNTLNEIHANDTTDYYPLVIETEEPISKKLRDYNNALKANGFEIAMTEGTTYLDQDRDFIAKHFYSFISPTLKEYLTQLNKENKEGFSEDGGLTITPTQLADRIIWWEDFINKNTNFIFLKEAKIHSEDYLTFLLIGMDNTPVLSIENNKLDSRYAEAYRHLQKTAPNSKANKLVQPYFKALQKSDTARANALIKLYQKSGVIYNPYSG